MGYAISRGSHLLQPPYCMCVPTTARMMKHGHLQQCTQSIRPVSVEQSYANVCTVSIRRIDDFNLALEFPLCSPWPRLPRRVDKPLHWTFDPWAYLGPFKRAG